MPNDEINKRISLDPIDLLKWRSAINALFEAPWVAQLTEALGAIQANIAPVIHNFEKIMVPVHAAIPKYAKVFEVLGREHEKYRRFEKAGWLPHETAPFHLLEEASDENLSSSLHDYYLENWQTIKQGFLKTVPEYSIDDEAKATFIEALEAHTNGLYRVAPRLLFPEIERVTRNEFNEDFFKGVARQRRLKDAAGRLLPYEFKPGAFYGTELYIRLSEHLYEDVNDYEKLERCARDPVPNRHASLHGLVIYSTMQNSLNALIMTDFIFQIIGPIKSRVLEEIAAEVKRPSKKSA